MDETMTEIAASLATLVSKGTATAINARIKALKEEKSTDRIRAAYEEIVSQLLDERAEAVRIVIIRAKKHRRSQCQHCRRSHYVYHGSH